MLVYSILSVSRQTYHAVIKFCLSGYKKTLDDLPKINPSSRTKIREGGLQNGIIFAQGKHWEHSKGLAIRYQPVLHLRIGKTKISRGNRLVDFFFIWIFMYNASYLSHSYPPMLQCSTGILIQNPFTLIRWFM